VEASLRGTPVTTREDLLATVYSAVNGALALGNNVTPLLPVAREGPAIAGDVNGNFLILGQDAQAIAQQLIGTENDASALFNLFASTQNNLGQTIRQMVHTSGSRRYREEFISNTNLGTCTATIDFNAGVAALPLVSEAMIQPGSIDFGVACDGVLGSGTTDLLLDGKTETSMVWAGRALELVFNFNTVQILNRFRIELAGYQGLVVTEFSSSPDGIIREDLMADLQPTSESLDGSSGKFSGDWIADFDPRRRSKVKYSFAFLFIISQLAILIAAFLRHPGNAKSHVKRVCFRCVPDITGCLRPLPSLFLRAPLKRAQTGILATGDRGAWQGINP
jgi:hypothetical protein